MQHWMPTAAFMSLFKHLKCLSCRYSYGAKQPQREGRNRNRPDPGKQRLFRQCALVLTLQLLSSSAFTMMVPHFFPWMPLYTNTQNGKGLGTHNHALRWFSANVPHARGATSRPHLGCCWRPARGRSRRWNNPKRLEGSVYTTGGVNDAIGAIATGRVSCRNRMVTRTVCQGGRVLTPCFFCHGILDVLAKRW